MAWTLDEVDLSPRRKLALGVAALACLLVVSLALDAVSDAVFSPVEAVETTAAAEDVDGDDGGAAAEDAEGDDGEADTEAKDEEDVPDEQDGGEASGDDQAAASLGGFEVASGAELLDALTDTELSTLGDYVAARAAVTDGIGADDTVSVTSIEWDYSDGAVVGLEFSSGTSMVCSFGVGNAWEIEIVPPAGE